MIKDIVEDVQTQFCTWSRTYLYMIKDRIWSSTGLYLIMIKNKTSSESNYVFDDDQRHSWRCSNTVLYMIKDILVHDQRPYLKLNKVFDHVQVCPWSCPKLSLNIFNYVFDHHQRHNLIPMKSCLWSWSNTVLVELQIWSLIMYKYVLDHVQNCVWTSSTMFLIIIKDIIWCTSMSLIMYKTVFVYLQLCLWSSSKT